MALKIQPVTRKIARCFIAKHHRHNVPSLQAVFQIGLAENGVLVGVAMVGIPRARLLTDGQTLEVTRVCVLEGIANANSMLYGASARAAKALGYSRLVTYTLTTESGSSLKAAGWRRDEKLSCADVRNWERHGGRGIVDLFGNVRIPAGPKYRWWKEFNDGSG